MKKNDLKFITAGALAGLANGFFGAGGGMVLVPMFCGVAKLEDRRALATSVAVILPMSVVSAVIYYLRGGFSLAQAAPFLIGGLAGGILAGRFFNKMPPALLRRGLGVMILWGGIRSFLK